MDLDADKRSTADRIDRIERFLDRVQPDWQSYQGGPFGRSNPQDVADVADRMANPRPPAMGVGTFNPGAAPKSEGLVEDDEQTRRDRESLGLPPLPQHQPDQYPTSEQPQDVTYTDGEGNVWHKISDNEWATNDDPDDPDASQTFSGTLDELKILTASDSAQ